MKTLFKAITVAAMLLPVLFSCTKSNDLTTARLEASTKNNSVATCSNTYTCTAFKAAMVQRDSIIYGAVQYVNTNYSNYSIFKAESWITSTHILDSRSLIKFTLPPNFFSGFTFCQADLVLRENRDPNSSLYLGVSNPYNAPQPNNAALLVRVKRNWNRSTVTWNTQPITTSVNAATVPAVGTGAAYMGLDNQTINITALMQDVQNSGSDHGIEIMMPIRYLTTSARQFGAKNPTVPSLKAQLVFYY